MNKKQKFILLAIVFSLAVLFSGLTFAYFTSQTNNESASTIYAKGGTMNIKYANGSGNIVVSGIYPRETEWADKTFTVTGNNSTELEMGYRIYLVTRSNGFNYGDLTYSISGTSTNATDTLVQKENQNIPKTGDLLIGSGTFRSNSATHSYSLKIYYKDNGENQNSGQSKSYTAYVKIDTGSTLAYDSLITSSSSSETSAVFNGPITRQEVETINFKTDATVPANAIDSWDASEKQNGSVMAYTLDEDNDNLYELYIGQAEKIILGPDATRLFSGFSKITTLDVSNLDTSHVTNMHGMFYYSNITSIIGLNNFDTSNVTDMGNMFNGSRVTSLDLSSFNTSKVTTMSTMFSGCRATSLDVSSFDTSNVTNMSNMFSSTSATSIVGLNNFNTSKITDMTRMFSYSKATSLDVSSFDTSNVTKMTEIFYNSNATSIVGLNNLNTSKITDMTRVFSNSKATSLDVSGLDTSNVTTMEEMFGGANATSITGLDKFNTSKVTSMKMMFNKCKATSLDVSSFDTSKVTSMKMMFSQSEVTTINGLTNFNTSKVTDMNSMFFRSLLSILDLSSFDTSSVTNMQSMFYGVTVTTGYARTQEDADRFNASYAKPSGLTFVVKS